MKTVDLKLTAAIGIAGQLIKAGTIVTVPETEGKALLQRGKAVLATAADDPAPDDEPEAPKPLTKAEKKAAEKAAADDPAPE